MSCVSVFIVNYNGAQFIKPCLDSLLSSECTFDLDIIVIDNSSSDNSLDVLIEFKNRVTLIKNHYNSGFSKANNIAASYAKGDYYFLLNNDTVINPNTLQLLFDCLIQEYNVGAVVPKLLNSDGSLQCPGSFFGSKKYHSNKPVDVSFVSCAAILMTRSVYELIGGLDDNFFFYNDDVDLSKVLQKKKLRMIYFPEASLIHHGGLSTSFRSTKSLIEGYRGGFYIARKHYGWFIAQLYRWVVMLDVIPRFLFSCFMSLFNSRYKSYISAYWSITLLNFRNDIYTNHPEVKVEIV